MRSIALSASAVAAMVATLISAALADLAATSAYTSLDKGCKVLRSSADESKPEIDYFESICPGRDGMRVIVEGGDSRSWIGLLPHGVDYKDGARFYEPLMATRFGNFPNVAGQLLEWRYHGSKLVALIVRMSGSNPNGDDSSGLVVLRVNTTKLDQTCAIGKMMSNEEARAIADDPGKPCL